MSATQTVAKLRSCEACRTSKIRCTPANVSKLKCQRCERLGKSCVYPEVKPRSRKNTSNINRVRALEAKIDRLSSLLQQAPDDPEVPPSQSQDGPGQLLFDKVSSNVENINELGAHLTPPDSRLGYSEGPTPSYQSHTASALGDVISKGWLTPTEAEELVSAFRTDFGSFPFVVLPQISLERMRTERPSLLLAMLLASSRKNYAMQQAFDNEFRTMICTQIIMDGVRSLELLQGLLIYTSWYYLRFTPMDKQLYMLVQLMMTMALDMDLDKPRHTDEESEEESDIKRTFLGVYYFSSCTSLVLRKPITMRQSFSLWDCARSLAAMNKAPSDPHLIHFVHLQGLAEEIAETFGYVNDSGRHLLTMSGLESVEFKVNAFNHRLQQLRVSISLDTPVSSTLLLTCNSVAVYLYEVALHIPAVPTAGTVAGQNIPVQPQALSALSNLLWACLTATKTLFDNITELTTSEIIAQTIVEKGHLAHAAVTLIKLAFAKIPGLDGFPLRHACNVSYYFDRIGERMGEISATQPYAEYQDCFTHFKNTAQVIKTWYERIAASSGSLDELQGMNPLQLADIAKENSALQGFDWSSLDGVFAEGNLSWNTMWV